MSSKLNKLFFMLQLLSLLQTVNQATGSLEIRKHRLTIHRDCCQQINLPFQGVSACSQAAGPGLVFHLAPPFFQIIEVRVLSVQAP
jgi:hypothetical protein